MRHLLLAIIGVAQLLILPVVARGRSARVAAMIALASAHVALSHRFNFDFVHGDYGYDRMDGGPGKGDIASFATDVGSGRDGGVKVNLARHKARGDGHDRLFRFESLEGSAFEDILVGNGQANVIDGGAGDDVLRGGGGPDHLLGGQGNDRCNGAKGKTISCGREAKLKASAYAEIDPVSGGGGGLELIGGGGADHFVRNGHLRVSRRRRRPRRRLAVG